MKFLLILLALLLPLPCLAQPALQIEVVGPPEPLYPGKWPKCDAGDIPDAPARAIRTHDGGVQLYVSNQVNRLEIGRDLTHLRHDCTIVLKGAENDDPAAFDDRAWIASPWTTDGRTIWAVVHDEFHGDRRPALCPTGRYMDCWYNALTLVVSRDGGRSFRPPPGRALIAALPYRYDQVGRGHHGYFNPSNILRVDGAFYMFTFATKALSQREGNCLLRTTRIDDAAAWRAWDGAGFVVRFIDPYTETAPPEEHVCAAVGSGALRWPVTSLVRHAPTGLFVATMQNTARDGGVFYATSPDLLHWSQPALLIAAAGPSGWTCGDPGPIAYPSLLDPSSDDPNFQTVGDDPLLFVTRFQPESCKLAMSPSHSMAASQNNAQITSGALPV